MTVVKWCPHTWCDDDIAWGRWDQLWLGRILDGQEGHPPAGYRFEQASFDEVRSEGGVLVLPVGHYAECAKVDIVTELNATLRDMPWGVVFATSDECSSFPWHFIEPAGIQFYIQLPRIDKPYPFGARFFGEGSPVSAVEIQTGAAFTRDLDLFLSAQGGHERRDQCFDAMGPNFGFPARVDVRKTDGFTQGDPPEVYYHNLTRAWLAPAPSGICSQSSFRAFEAAEAGAIPVVDGLRPGGQGAGFWELLGLGDVFPVIDDWSMFPADAADLLSDREFRAAKISSAWQQYKRRFVNQIHDDIDDVQFRMFPRDGDAPHDLITVIVPTSPVPSNPDLSMIQETVASIRTDLPGAEILITCDGVRPEQEDRTAAYHSFLHRLCVWALTQHNVTPFVSGKHLHQSGMMQWIIDEIRTPYLLYVEHDCPIIPPVPWADLLTAMHGEELNLLRLLHEVDIHETHRHLFIDDEPRPGPAPYMRTVQWSQRPHLAKTDFYRHVLGSWFGAGARTMIEDVMHGVVQHGYTYTDRIRAEKHWDQWRMAVYAPEGSMKRSGHLDGRGADPKFPMFIDYDGPRPIGAPPEGWWR